LKSKKVLIITYYWPSSGGPGVKRALFFSKHLKKFGWEPVIYTVKNGDYPHEDSSLLEEIPNEITILKQKAFEPYNLYRAFMGKSKNEKLPHRVITSEQDKNISLHNFALWVRANFFIPDARKLWIKPSIKYLVNYLKENPVDAIVSTAPPYSVHQIAKEVANILSIKWIADFRDPWTQVYFFNQLPLTDWARKLHFKYEKQVANQADILTVVSEEMKDYFKTITNKRIAVLTNGYEIPDSVKDILPDKKLSIAFIGDLYKERIPHNFFEALLEVMQEKPTIRKHLEIKIMGSLDAYCQNYFKSKQLSTYLNYKGYVNYVAMFAELKKSQILLSFGLKDTKEVIPSKLFDYIGAERTIFHLGPLDASAVHLIREINAGYCADYDDKTLIKKHLFSIYNLYEENDHILPFNSRDTQQYSRFQKTKELSILLDSLFEVELIS